MKAATKYALLILLGILCMVVSAWGAPKLYQAYQMERSEKAKAEAELAREEELRQAQIEYPFLDNIVIKRYQGKDYYVSKKSYEGEYDCQKLHYEGEPMSGKERLTMEHHHIAPGEEEMREVNERPLEESEITKVMDYEEYVDYCEEWRLDQKYTDPDMKYIVRSSYTETYFVCSSLSDVRYEDSAAVLYFVEESSSMFDNGVKIYVVPTDQNVDTVEVVQVYAEHEYENILEFGQTVNPYIEQ